MQVSIYLREELVRKVDSLAKRERRSRSKIIEALVNSSLKRRGSEESRIASLVGAWKNDRTAKEIIEEIYKDRDRNRRSDRANL
ncbi:MAG: ribbon-helix-helix protein, CopG family [Nitrospirae bacterium]|nr:ribbon-helix-helix protein, CopG family [Nitrospirota bacterium]